MEGKSEKLVSGRSRALGRSVLASRICTSSDRGGSERLDGVVKLDGSVASQFLCREQRTSASFASVGGR